MDFTSYTYFSFLALSVAALRFVHGVWRERILLSLSLVFYAAWDVRFLPVLLGLGGFTYVTGTWLAKRRGQLRALLAPIGAILLILGFFKYTGLVVDIANLFTSGRRFSAPRIILPLGISFFTFECISYLLDIYKGGPELKPLRRFLLFPAFWPHMVAGPILRVKEFAPQLEKEHQATGFEILQGIDRVLFGVLKKLLFANALSSFVDQGFANGATSNSALDDWILALAFGLQIYFDFSAYSDIAIGSAKMVGISFPENFNLPYHSTSPSEFWNRWHMTLSRWIRDYLFFPLNLRAGRRIWLRYVFLVIVMSLVGLWHGAGLAFILWGTWHGCLMVLHRLLEPRVPTAVPEWVRKLGGWVLTMIGVQAGWILFRAPTAGQAFHMLWTMLSLRGLRPAFGVNDYLVLALALGFYLFLEPRVRAFVVREPSKEPPRWTFWLRPVAYALCIQGMFLFDRTNVAFIYFQF